jgi:CRISPR-associated protein Cas2
VTRNVPGRFRGFLASCMCEVAPGIYTAPRMTAGVRGRVWRVLQDWFQARPERAVVMTWADADLPGGQDFLTLGVPRKELSDHHGVYLARRDLTEDELKELQSPVESEDAAERDEHGGGGPTEAG